MAKVKLTNELIQKGLQCPTGKAHCEFCDTEVPGLLIGVHTTKPGAGIFRLRFKDNGKTTYYRIGRTTEVSLKDARRTALRLKADIAAGKDPNAAKKQAKAMLTFTELMDEHYLPYVESRKRTAKNDKDMFERRLKARFGNIKLDQIKRKDVEAFHADLAALELAPATCDHHIKLMRHALNMAVEWEFIETNALARIRLFKADNKVENIPSALELQRLLEVLHTSENRSVCNLALFLLSTGARLNEALTATWPNIDLDKRRWFIRAENSKSKKGRWVPLNGSAIEVLGQLQRSERSNRLFISTKTGQPLKYVHKVWGRLRVEAGLPNLRLHDLRHQYASLLVNNGRSLYEVQAILGHSDPQVTQRYAHLADSVLQEASQAASDALGYAPAKTAQK